MTDLSPERIEAATVAAITEARRLKIVPAKVASTGQWTLIAEAVLRADTEWRARNERPADYSWQNGFEAGQVITRDQALAAIAATKEEAKRVGEPPWPLMRVRAEFLRRIGETT